MPQTDRSRVLITGASAGIGRDLAEEFARHGRDLLIVARTEEALREAAVALEEAHGIECDGFVADLSGEAARVALFEHVQSRGYAVDTVVNNAGFGWYGPFVEAGADVDLGMIDLNVAALTHLTKLFLPAMVRSRAGRILNVASVAAFQPGPLMAVYYATKAYVLSFSEALAEELHDSGVTVTTLCPGTTRTGFQQRAGLGARGAETMPSVMDSRAVARVGYEALMAGKRVVVTGGKNRIFVQLNRVLPRKALTRMVRKIQEKRRALSAQR